MNRTAIIDLFAGAGGLGLGAHLAAADVKLSVEIDPIACETLQANAGATRILQADVSQLTGRELRKAAGLSRRDPVIVTGGAPCQPFSKAAYWTEPGIKVAWIKARASGKDVRKPAPREEARPDVRRDLVSEYVRLVLETKADGFVFENVPSLFHPRNKPIVDNFLGQLGDAKYEINIFRGNAVGFGVAQRRERIFIYGSKRKKPRLPEVTHSEEPTLICKRAVSAADAISRFSSKKYFEPEEVVQGRWAEHLSTIPPGSNYKAHTAWAGHPEPTWETETRFWNFLLKLHPEKPSWTIAASPGPWTGPFHWESRRLRIPELAALQGFPSGYKFVGTRREKVKQIGNAVPPPMGGAVIHEVLMALGGT
jgi:DNA (cytosine-5)-methyltransferase 1